MYFEITAQGHGQFPIEVLRFGHAYPVSSDDVFSIESETEGMREVTIATTGLYRRAYEIIQLLGSSNWNAEITKEIPTIDIDAEGQIGTEGIKVRSGRDNNYRLARTMSSKGISRRWVGNSLKVKLSTVDRWLQPKTKGGVPNASYRPMPDSALRLFWYSINDVDLGPLYGNPPDPEGIVTIDVVEDVDT